MTTSIIGQGVLANIILRNTLPSGELQRTDMAETCSPSPPICCGVPSRRAFLRRLQCSSCCIVPCEKPKKDIWIPDVVGRRQLSLPPAPMTVGAMEDITGADWPAPVALLLVVLLVVALLLSTSES